MILNHNAFRQGDWIQTKYDGRIGWIDTQGEYKSVIFFPKTGERIKLYNTSIHKLGGTPCAEDILAMADIPLLTGDEDWLREIVRAYDRQWRREMNINS